MMLRYATIMQRGVKQSSDAYARIMASIGSLERVVELHDRGVFRDAAKSLGKEEFPVRLTAGCSKYSMRSCTDASRHSVCVPAALTHANLLDR
jgi:hypothetical protein